MAHNCVSATIRVAAEMGYDVYAVRDAIGDRDIPGATAEELVRVRWPNYKKRKKKKKNSLLR